jgi:hypothetical protein
MPLPKVPLNIYHVLVVAVVVQCSGAQCMTLVLASTPFSQEDIPHDVTPTAMREVPGLAGQAFSVAVYPMAALLLGAACFLHIYRAHLRVLVFRTCSWRAVKPVIERRANFWCCPLRWFSAQKACLATRCQRLTRFTLSSPRQKGGGWSL